MFAPVDDAFAALPEGTVESLLEDPQGALLDVLLYHVVDGAVPAETANTLEAAPTLQGSEVTVSVVDGKVHIHDLHATMLHLLGIDHTQLTWNHLGRDFRLTDVHGSVVKEILA